MMKTALLLLALFATGVDAKQPEAYYQKIWCDKKGGSPKTLEDGSKVDCLTDEYAVEVGFSYNWAQDIGQARLYSRLTGKKPAVLMIVNNKSAPHLARFHNASDGLGIKLFVISE